jgi:uncharacterized membrane protein HdeD (DUF308 family)
MAFSEVDEMIVALTAKEFENMWWQIIFGLVILVAAWKWL